MELEGPNFAARRAELRREAREAATREATSKGSAQRQGQRGQGGGAPPAGGGVGRRRTRLSPRHAQRDPMPRCVQAVKQFSPRYGFTSILLPND